MVNTDHVNKQALKSRVINGTKKTNTSLTLFTKAVCTTLIFVVFLLSFASVKAQTNSSAGPGSQGLTISPFLIERQSQKGQATHEIINVRNTSAQTLTIEVSVNDFLPQGEDGQQVFLQPGEGDATYSLSSWITIDGPTKLTLQAGQQTDVNFTMMPPANAEDGGHYGAIIFSFQSSTASGTAVKISQKIGSIILAKTGKAREEGTISSFSTEHSSYNSLPVTFLTQFHNSGNVHVKPRGGITIKNMFGQKVATALVNPNANNVLPNSDRIFKSTWDSGFAFGRYTAEEQLVYGDTGQIVKAKTVFWVLQWKLVLGGALALAILIIILIYAMRAYNRRVLRQYARRRKQE